QQRLDRGMTSRRLGLLLVAGALSGGCYLPYPVPAGSVVDRTPAGPAEADPSWGGAECPVTLRQETLERINALRAERGLVAFRPHPELMAAAQAHSEDQGAR